MHTELKNSLNPLFARNGLPIIGLKLIDGSTEDFSYTEKDTKWVIIIDPNTAQDNTGDFILIDSEGNEHWLSDVQYYHDTGL